MGRRWTRQNPSIVETLLSKYSGMRLEGLSANQRARFERSNKILFQGLIFVVDSSDRERIQESHDELHKMVSLPTHFAHTFRLRISNLFIVK